MAMPATVEKRWTVAEVHALPDDPRHRYEVVDGELLVSPGPSVPHQVCAFELMKILDAFVERWGEALVLDGPAEVVPDEYTAMQPDVFVTLLRNGRLPPDWDNASQLLLAVEVLSPSTARYDRVKKRPKYLSMGAVYWIVDLDARVVEQWLPGKAQPQVLEERVEWRPAGAPAALVIELAEFFRRVFRER